jgi:hypothetical protein
MAVVAPTVFARVIVLALKGGRCENTARPLGPPVSELNADALRDGQDIAGWMVGIWYERTMEKKLNYSVTSKPMTADTDGDTMTDFDEFMNGSDPWKLDTDGDTITDPQEVARGSNITGIEGTPPEITNVKLRVAIHGHEEQLCTKLGCLPPFWVPDGWINVSTTPGAANWTGEDKNLNGIRDQDAEGNWTETDFQANDSDFDGVVDGADLRGTEEARGLAILF